MTTYDAGLKPVSATNRLDGSANIGIPAISRVHAALPADATITVASTTLTIQFKDAKGRNYRGRVFFTMIQTEVSPADAVPALAATGRLPAVGANTNGSTLAAITANKVVMCCTDADGLWVGTLTGALGTADYVGVAPMAGLWFGT